VLPQEFPVCRRGYDGRLFLRDVPIEEHHLFEAPYMIGVRVRNEVVLDVGDRQAKGGESLGRSRSAIYEDMIVSFNDEGVVLV
jgi:hypothetical protein